MSIQQDWEEAIEYTDQEPTSYRENQNVRPVKVEFEQTQNVAPESTSWMTWQVAQIGQNSQPSQICTHKYHRYKAKFLWTIPFSTIVYISRSADQLMSNALGTAFTITTGPGAAAVVTPAVPASATNVQNPNGYPVQVVIAGFTATAVSVNGVQVGTSNGTYFIPAYGTISITYTVAGTWTWTNPAAPTNALQAVPALPDYDGQQPLYAIANNAGVSVAVMDESYKAVQ